MSSTALSLQAPATVPKSAPFTSLFMTMLGTAVAVLLIPDRDYWEPNALVPSAVVLSMGLLGSTAVVALRDIKALLRTESVLMFGIFYWLVAEVALGRTNQYRVSYDALVRSVLAVGLFGSAVWSGSIFWTVFGPRASSRISRVANVANPQFLFWASVGSGILGLARYLLGCRFSPSCIAEAFYATRFGVPWAQVNTFGDFDTLFLYSRYFGFIVVPLTVALISLRQGRSWRGGIAVTLSLLCILLMFRDGGRKDVGTAIGAGVLTWALLRPSFRWRHLIVVSSIGALLLLILHWMLVWRDVGIGHGGLFESFSERPLLTVDGNFNFLSDLVYLVPDRVAHSGVRGVLFALTLWIPFNLPFVVRSRDIDLVSLLGLSVGPGFSWTASAVGDLYLINGLLAVLAGGAIFGVVAAWTSRRFLLGRTANDTISYSLITMTLFMSLRALHEMFVTGFIIGAFALFLWARTLLRRNTAKVPAG